MAFVLLVGIIVFAVVAVAVVVLVLSFLLGLIFPCIPMSLWVVLVVVC